MFKNKNRLFIIISIILFVFIFTIPVSSATQYGAIQGKVLDRYGYPLSGVTIDIQDGDCKLVGSTQSNADGNFNFNQVPIESNSGTFRIVARLDKNDTHLTEYTSFVMVYPLQSTSLDVTFSKYPSSGIGKLYGVVSSNKDIISETSGVVYINNGMYTIYDGNQYDTWSFILPIGDYIIWAEQNKNLTTYKSQNYSVHVNDDPNDPNYQPIYFPMKEQSHYHAQPVAQRNVVHGQVLQKNGQPLSGATVALGKLYNSSSMEPVGTSTTNTTGHYSFYDVPIQTVSEKFVVRVTMYVNGEAFEQSTTPFDVYYANTIGKPHDYNVPVTMTVVTTGNLNIITTPNGAHVYIDGADTGILTPCNISEVPIGQHDLTLVLDGYYDDTSEINIQREKTLDINRSLSISTGSLYLAVQPSDAKIYLDGQLAGTGTLNLPRKPAGKYQYEIVLDGYQNESGSLEVIPGKLTNKTFELVAVPALNLIYIGYLLNNMISSIASIF